MDKKLFSLTLGIYLFLFGMILFLLFSLSFVYASDTGFKSPTATGETYNNWLNPTYAYSSDNSYTYSSVVNQKQDYYDFTFGVPAGATIGGIEVAIEGKVFTGSAIVGVELSYDGGSSYTSSGKTGIFYITEGTRTYGGASDTWGRSWSDGEFSNANFRVRINNNAGYPWLDHIQVKVYYTEGFSSCAVEIDSDTFYVPSGCECYIGGEILNLNNANCYEV